jgi:hypothetical protein
LAGVNFMVTIHADHQRFTTTRRHDSFRIRPRTPPRTINVEELADMMNFHVTPLATHFAFIVEEARNDFRSGIAEFEPRPPDAEIQHDFRFADPVDVKSRECCNQWLLSIALDYNL